MKVYRIVRSKYSDDLSGFGAEKYGGRWNSPGRPLLYTSVTASLALLECLAWTPLNKLMSGNFVLLEIELINPSKESISSTSLSYEWNLVNNYPHTRSLGDSWLIRKSSLILQVPSAILPIENNILINPELADSQRIIINETFDLALDSRVVDNLNG